MTLRQWVPSATLTNGRVDVRGRLFEVPHANWRAGVASGVTVWMEHDLEAAVEGVVNANGIARLELKLERLGLKARFTRADTPGGLAIAGVVDWLTNSIALDAEFAATGRLPRRTTLKAHDFSIPADVLGLRGYDNVRGSLSAHWEQGKYQVACTASADAKTNVGVPPLSVNLNATGDTNAANVEAARITSSFITAELSEPLQVRYHPPYITESVTIKASADLAQQKWFPGRGRISTRASVFASNAKYPAANFEVFADSLEISNVAIRSLAIAGEFRWPHVIVPSAAIHLFDSVRVAASGDIDLQARSVVNGSLDLHMTNAPSFLGQGVTASNAVLSATLRGPLQDLAHEGKLAIASLETPHTKPALVTCQWEGQHGKFTNTELQIMCAKDSSLRIKGAADLASASRLIHLQEFTIRTNGHDALELAAPATITMIPTESTNRHGAISISSLRMKGQSHIAVEGVVAWPAYGRLTNSIRNLDFNIIEAFVRTKPLSGRITHLEMAAAWTNGPIEFALDAVSQWFATNGGVVQIDTRAAGNKAGITVQRLALSSEVAPGLSGEGVLPMTIHPGSGIELREEETLNFRLSTFPDSVVWNALASRLGLSLQDPSISAELVGSWKHPQGQVSARVAKVSLLRTNPPLPSFDNIEIMVDVNRERAALTRGHVEVERRPIEITGELPLGNQFWDAVVKKRVPFDWKHVKAHIVVPQTGLQPFAGLLPEILAPQGRFHADLTLDGGQVKGVARLQDLRTRPLPSLGPLRDLDIRAQFNGQQVRFHPIDATIGGRQVRGEGTVQLPADMKAAESLPQFHFRLWGANVPLVRQPDVIARADLELELTNSSALKTPEIRGGITMRKSYFLSDLEDLVPGKLAGPRRRPPYFSITNKLVADWRLAIGVRGKDFLQIRSPLFRGDASATLRLEGTLSEPTALGELRIGSGRILFPFASLEVQQGYVTLSSEDPYRPRIHVVASTRRIGYEIKLEVTGPADNPIVQFSSSPPLSPEQIVLMVTAGQMPTETARLTTDQRAQRMAVFLGGNLLREFGIGGGDEERLSVRSGEQLTESGSQTYEAEYRLTDDLSLVGEYDRFNEFNVGLKWRLYSK